MRVLIDGGYRSLAQGTGISSYARTLEAGLMRLGHEIFWLSGASASGPPDSLSDAAYAGDDRRTTVGLRRYLQTAQDMFWGLSQRRAEARPICEHGVVIPRPNDLPHAATLLAPDLFVRAHYRHMLLRQFTEVGIPQHPDILHLTAPLPIKVRHAKTIVTIHDLVPIRLPYTTSDNKREFIDRVRTSARLADLVMTVSEASKREIIDLLGVDPDRVVVTWQCSDMEPLNADEWAALPRALARYGLEQEQYGIFVGAIEPKKNLRRLIDAFLDAHDTMPLVIVGQKSWMWESEIGDLDQRLGDAARRRIRMVGHVSREDLRKLLAGARLLTFPSLYEGFGLPPLEAMQMGCPVVSSHSGGLAEVCGSATIVVDPWDTGSICRGISKVIGDDALRLQLREAGYAQASHFSSDQYLTRLADAYGRLM
jgi:glycosyltransferase involved in cell wall biosynthesis